MADSLDDADWKRPPQESIKHAFDRVFRSQLTLPLLREAALDGRALFERRPGSHDDTEMGCADGVVGRSILWKLLLLPASPLDGDADLPTSPPLSELRVGRKSYNALAMHRLKGPHQVQTTSEKTTDSVGSKYEGLSAIEGSEGRGWEHNNPLSQDLQNPWQQWFLDSELRKVIRQDVERTFPDILYFSGPRVQDMMTTILFLYSTTNPSLGYRQGMHEILGSVVMAVDYDSVMMSHPFDALDAPIVEFCSRDYVAADSYILFDVIMRGIRRWYEWQEPRSGVGISSDDRSTWVSPIIQACTRIQDKFLRAVDPVLWSRMNVCGIEPQIYGMRWLRLLFTREFALPDAMLIWDALFAIDVSLDLAEWICVAMLVRIRNLLLSAGDYTGMLTCLLRYPTPSPSFSSLVVKHAAALRSNPMPAEAGTAMMENQNHFGMLVGSGGSEELSQQNFRPAKDSGGHRTLHSSSRTQKGFTELIARSLLEGGETLGLNKALLTTVSELRRNLPDLPNLSRALVNSSMLQSSHLGTSADHNDIHGLSEIERDRGQLLLQLGRAMERALRTLESRSWADAQEREALSCLEHVRDVLLQRMDVSVAKLALDSDIRDGKDRHRGPVAAGWTESMSPPASKAVLPSLPRISPAALPSGTVLSPAHRTAMKGTLPPHQNTKETRPASADNSNTSVASTYQPSGAARRPRVEERGNREPLDGDDDRRREPLDPLGALKG